VENKLNGENKVDSSSVNVDVTVVIADNPGELELDESGYFRIVPDQERMLILAKHYSYDKQLLTVIEGPDARSIYRAIIKYGWVTTLNHAAYLGQELARAEIAMKAGFDYVQG